MSITIAGASQSVSATLNAVAPKLTNFVNAGGKIYVCTPCLKKRNLDENNLVPGAIMAGGAKVVEFMGEACPSLSY